MPEIQHPSHEAYVIKCREMIWEIAHAILNGTIGIIEGSHHLSALRTKAELALNDDFELFDVISSESDTLPVGDTRQHWNKEALEEKDWEIKEYEAKMKSQVVQACQNILDKLRHDSS